MGVLWAAADKGAVSQAGGLDSLLVTPIASVY